MTRKIILDGVENFRDFGDYPTRDGRHIKRGLLYRSAHHHHASEADLAAIAAISPAVIIDLRRRIERDREPSARWEGFGSVVIDNDIGHTPDDPWLDALKQADLSADWFREDAKAFYRATPFEDRHVDLFSRYFRSLAETDGPILVHCAAGKDRTGMICALTHHVLGVDHEHIVADFLLTNDEARYARRGPILQEIMVNATGRELDPDALIVAMGVEAGYLDAAFEEMARRSGSIDAYLEKVLGVDGALREALEARLLE